MVDKARPRPPPGQCALFDALPEQALSRILARGFDVEVPRGATFYREGGEPRCFLVQSGLVRVYLESAEGRQVTVRYARPGDLLGVAAAVAGPAPVAAQALVDSRLLAFDPAALVEAGRRNPTVAFAIAEELGRRLYVSLEQLAVNAFGSLRERIARHPVATMLAAALLAAAVLRVLSRRRDLAVAVGLGIASHLVLDLLTHAPDLVLAPGVPAPRLGLGLHSAARPPPRPRGGTVAPRGALVQSLPRAAGCMSRVGLAPASPPGRTIRVRTRSDTKRGALAAAR